MSICPKAAVWPLKSVDSDQMLWRSIKCMLMRAKMFLWKYEPNYNKFYKTNSSCGKMDSSGWYWKTFNLHGDISLWPVWLTPHHTISSRKHTNIILTPLNLTFMWGLQGVYCGLHGDTLLFLLLLENIDCGYSLESPLRDGCNEYHNQCFWEEIWKISEFLSENFQFLVVIFSIYLNRRVFVMYNLLAALCFH